MFHKVVSVINAIFALALAAGFGLVCYYYVWVSNWNIAAKVFSIIGFSLCGLICGGYCGFLAWDTWDSPTDLCKDTVEFGIIGILICGVIPGILYLIACGVNGEPMRHSSPRVPSSGGSTYKKEAPDYDPKKDPTIIRKTSTKDVTKPPKKKLVYEPKNK